METMGNRQSGTMSHRGSPVGGGRWMGAEKEKVMPPGERTSPSRQFRKSLSGLLRDAAKLADLQVQLLGVDVRDFWSQAKVGLLVLIAATVALLSAIPVLLFGLGYLLHNVWGWSEQSAFLSVGGLTIVLSAIALYWTLQRLTYSGTKLNRSMKELESNLRWFRQALHEHDGKQL